MAALVAELLSNPSSQGPLTICLNGPWGSGKSSHLYHIASELRTNFATCVFFDAWHHQNEDHLFAALMESIRKSWRPSWRMSYLPTPYRKLSFAVKLSMFVDFFLFYLRLWWVRFAQAPFVFSIFFVVFASSAVTFGLMTLCSIELLSGERLSDLSFCSLKIGDSSTIGLFVPIMFSLLVLTLYLWNSPWNALKAFPVSPIGLITASAGWLRFTQAADQLSFRYRFQVALRDVCEVLAFINRKLVVIIDDLDRCDHDHIKETLEAVNFLTSSAPCFVVLAMDKERVVRALEAVGNEDSRSNSDGNLRESELFLEKIVNVSVNVPSVTPFDLRKLSSQDRR